MKLAALFSGGKDSSYAMYKAMQYHKIECLITIQSENPHSYMFHTPNIELTELQAEAIGLPLLAVRTKGVKEKELDDLKKAIKKAKELFQIQGVVTGAIESVYQATRIQKICNELDLWCFNPLWQKNQIELLNELLKEKFEVIISGVFAYPFDEKWLGRKINKETINELIELKEKYKINPAGEGGEFETFVTNAPFFKKKIVVRDYTLNYKEYSGTLIIKNASLKRKNN